MGDTLFLYWLLNATFACQDGSVWLRIANMQLLDFQV